jgi:putative heme-binding domain-containing protein
MQYGLDNWIWGMQGYNRSRITLKNGEQTEFFNQGFFRFKSDASKFEFIRSTDNNTWGLGISEEGIVFGSTANRNPSTYVPIPNRYYERVRGWAPSLMLHTIADTYLFKPITDKVRQVDQHGGYTAAAGHALYTARNYPKEYWNRTALVSDPTGHLVGTFVLRREGSHFRSSNPFNLLASDDEWSAPIMAEVGPDGNVWVIDWYNYIVQHNPTPQGFKTGKGAAYESDLRDQKHGRIYRIVYDGSRNGRDQKASFTLAGADAKKLVETLKNDNLFWRRHAQRLLVERGQQDVVPALCALARDPGSDEIGLNVGVIHALWTLHGLGALDGSNEEATAVACAALKHESAGVRRNAVQVLPRNEKSVAAILNAGLTRDGDAQVRLLALLALADQPSTPAASEAIVAALNNPDNANDRWIPDAATCAAAHNSEHFLKALAAPFSLSSPPANGEGEKVNGKPSAKLLAVTTIVAEHYARGGPVSSVGALLTRLADADPPIADAVLRGLAKGWPAKQSPRLDNSLEQALERIEAKLPPERRGLLIKLATTWGSTKFANRAAEVARSLLERVKNETLKADERISAARELIGLRLTDKETVQNLLELITPNLSPELAAGFLGALQGSEVPEAGKLLLERLNELTPSLRATGFGLLLSRPDWTRALLESAAKGQVQLMDLSLDQKQALVNHPSPGIRRRASDLLNRKGGLPNPDRQKVLEEFLPITREKGNATAGKLVFKNQCAKCHVHGDEGTRIGPDLTGMAVHPKDQLLTDILDPSRSVEANFRVYTVTTNAGRVLTGLLASESRTAIELFDAEGKKQTILRQDIDRLEASTKSLMPEGFEKQISRKELTDLLEFLAQRGKYLPLPLTKVASAVSTRGMFYSETAAAERLVFSDWKPKTFEGVPFHLIDPQGDRVPNVILFHSTQGKLPPNMPKSVTLPCNAPAKAIHFLSGVSGWGFPYSEKGSTSLIVRLHYADGKTEDHALKNGEQFADYIRKVDVPGSKFAFNLQGRQIRYLVVQPRQQTTIEKIELIKGSDDTAPVVMAVTVETLE